MSSHQESSPITTTRTTQLAIPLSTSPYLNPYPIFDNLPLPPNDLLTPAVAGTASFATTLSLSTLIQHRLLRLSTGSPAPIPSLVGIATVACASVVSHVASVKAFEWNKERQQESLMPWKRQGQRHGRSFENDGVSSFIPVDCSMTSSNVAHLIRV